jgi:hypothetical protein
MVVGLAEISNWLMYIERRGSAIPCSSSHGDQTMYDIPATERVIVLEAHPQPAESAKCPGLGIELRGTIVTLRQDRGRRMVTEFNGGSS